jgi:hypothetical protein
MSFGNVVSHVSESVAVVVGCSFEYFWFSWVLSLIMCSWIIVASAVDILRVLGAPFFESRCVGPICKKVINGLIFKFINNLFQDWVLN